MRKYGVVFPYIGREDSESFKRTTLHGTLRGEVAGSLVGSFFRFFKEYMGVCPGAGRTDGCVLRMLVLQRDRRPSDGRCRTGPRGRATPQTEMCGQCQPFSSEHQLCCSTS